LFSTIPAWPWVTVYPPAGSSEKATVTAGGTAVWILNAWDGGNGYVGIANFTCIDLPPGATCTISPAQISVSTTPVPITVTVTTTAAKSATLIVPGFGGFSLALCLLFGTSALTFRGKLRNTGWLLCLATLALSTLSCGGGSGGGGSTPVAPSTPTPPGIYSITVHETTGTAYNWYPLTLTVQ